ncbi:MAG: hypothetical protein ACRDOD_02685 [Streptosporangiaceae bacterium]
MSDDRGQGDIRLVTALWARAEGQLYPLVMSDPDAFERALTVVRAIADRLRAETTAEELARAFTGSGALAMIVANEIGTHIGDLDAGVLTAAGFRLRQQEIAAGAGMAGDGEPGAGAPGEEREEQMR